MVVNTTSKQERGKEHGKDKKTCEIFSTPSESAVDFHTSLRPLQLEK